MYGKKYPLQNELVVCTVSSISPFNVTVQLNEYDKKEGFIHIKDVAQGWIKNINTLLKKNKKIVCKVINIDHQKKHIDLSLKSVNLFQQQKKMKQWKDEKSAFKLLELLINKMSITLEDSYSLFVNPLLNYYETLYDAFEYCALNPDLFQEEFKGDWVNYFFQIASENILIKPITIHNILSLTSTLPNGITIIKDSIEQTLKKSKNNNCIKVQYAGAPKYKLIVTANNQKTAESILKSTSSLIIDNIEKKGGIGKILI